MNTRGIFSINDVGRLRKEGHLVITLRDPTLLKSQVEAIQRGLDLLETIGPDLEDAFNMHRDNKDKDKDPRLLQGLFKKAQDAMVQCNFVDFTDGRMDDYVQIMQAKNLDCRAFLLAMEKLNTLAHTHITDLGHVLDTFIKRAISRGELECPRYSIKDLLLHPRMKTITSATRYRAQSDSELTSARPNTAAFAIYWLATNPGMRVIDKDGHPHPLSMVETDPERVVIIPGTQLARATNKLIHASKHPIFPKMEGAKRFTLRTFIYFSQEHMDYLIRDTPTDDILMI